MSISGCIWRLTDLVYVARLMPIPLQWNGSGFGVRDFEIISGFLIRFPDFQKISTRSQDFHIISGFHKRFQDFNKISRHQTRFLAVEIDY